MKQLAIKLTIAVVSFVGCFAIVDWWYGTTAGRLDAITIHRKYEMKYADENRRPVTVPEAVERGIIVPMPAELTPRPRMIWRANSTFYLCYPGAEQPYFDDHACVRVDINSRQIREREELVGAKPEGQTRILCLGDSFTFGWGVPVELAWPRLVERELRNQDDGVRTINCGASGTMQVDEYWWALDKRFGELDPDVVVVTLCLNDLLPTNSALCHYNERPQQGWYSFSNLLTALMVRDGQKERLRIDPDRDLVQQLLDLPEEHYAFLQWVQSNGGRSAFWPGGGPQNALRAMRDWCAQREVGFGVVIWPYFQGLGPGEHYPFTKMHRLVEEFCETESIPFLDLLPTFRGTRPTDEYWVSPADAHGDHEAHAAATPAITAFIAERL